MSFWDLFIAGGLKLPGAFGFFSSFRETHGRQSEVGFVWVPWGGGGAGDSLRDKIGTSRRHVSWAKN